MLEADRRFGQAIADTLGIRADQTISITFELSGTAPARVTIVQLLTADQITELTRIFELSSWQEQPAESLRKEMKDG